VHVPREPHASEVAESSVAQDAHAAVTAPPDMPGPRQSEVTPLPQRRSTDVGVPPRRRRPLLGALAVIFLVLAVLVVLPFLVAVGYWLSSDSGPPGSHSLDVKMSGDLEFHRGDPRLLGVDVNQFQLISDILRAADHDYVSMEAEHQKRKEDDGNLVVTVLPFPEQV